MRSRVITGLLLGGWAAVCSGTPGDAAYRAGQPAAAAKLYRQGALQGDAEAALKLGLLLSKTQIADYGKPGEWFLKACDLGNVVGCHNAGVGYENEEHGLAKNYKDAELVYRKAAERGYMQAQYNLASLYSNQYITGDVEGLKWMLLARKAAQECLPKPLCQWILDDPPEHTLHLKRRLSEQGAKSAEQQAASWVAVK